MQTFLSEPSELGRLLVSHWRRGAVAALLITAAAAVYAVVAPKTWQATQALIVRPEAIGSGTDEARARGPEDLKNVEETVVELSKSRGVLRSALEEVGPAATPRGPWPGDADQEALEREVKIVPPKGVEFGTSEVFYLEVRDSHRQRAEALSTALCRQLQLHLQQLRDAKARSMTDELEKAVQVAKADLKAATARLTELETGVGSDLPELRSMLDSNSSDTSLRRTVSEIENELRQCRAAESINRQLLNLLNDAQSDPGRLVAAPNQLLDSQPALRRLKDGLVDAQLRTATLEGRMSADHPEVVAAREAERQVAQRLHTELATAIRGVELDLAVSVSRIAFLEHQRQRSAERIDRLAGLRATYANLLSETSNRTKLLERTEQSLETARSTMAGAAAASLISPVDGPDTGAGPVSPSGKVVVLGGLLLGLLTGVGIILLTAPAEAAAMAGRSVPGKSLAAYAARECATVSVADSGVESWSVVLASEGDLTLEQNLKTF